MEFAWHGGASFSLRLGGVEVLVDPAFSRPGDYPAWFDSACVNPHSPTAEVYLRDFAANYVIITHGHFDHFDLRTLERIAAARPVLVAGSPEVLKACRDLLGLGSERLLSFPRLADDVTPPGRSVSAGFTAARREPDRTEGPWLRLRAPGSGCRGDGPAPRVRPVPGPHWFTGAGAEAVAAEFRTRPERYGAVPCGGPMLALLFELDDGRGLDARGLPLRIYASGDTEPAGLPRGPFDLAIVACGGRLVNPVTKLLEEPWLDEVTLARAACRTLRSRVLIPVHYDHRVFKTPFDVARLQVELRRYSDPPVLLVPPHNTWVPALQTRAARRRPRATSGRPR